MVKRFNHYGLAVDKVRFVGEPVAAIVAQDRYVAEDALELIEAEFDPLPAVVDEEAALREDSALVYEEWGDNVMVRFRVRHGDVDGAFRNADVVIQERLKFHRLTATPMEPRAILAHYHPTERLLEMHDTTQIPHLIASLLEDSLDIPHLRVRIQSSPVGGGFGVKHGYYPEEWVLAVLAIEVRRPLKWVELRREHMVSISHGREQTHRVEMALSRDGRILALRDTVLANAGVAYPQPGPGSFVATAMFLPGAYKIPCYEATVLGVATNKPPYGAVRGFGKSEAAYVIERMMDIAAARLGMDPAELRLRNFIQPHEFPYTSASGGRYDSGNYPAALRRALELLEYKKWRAEQRRLRDSGERNRFIGIGMAVALEPSATARIGSYIDAYFTVTIRIDPGGHVLVLSSGNDEGQKHATAAAQLVAQELGVDPGTVTYVEGDTLLCPYGSGSYSSRFSVVGTSAIIGAARRLRSKVTRIAAHLLGADEAELVLEHGAVATRSGDKRVTLRDVARAAYHRLWELPPGEEPGLEVTHMCRVPNVDRGLDANGRGALFSAYPYTADAAVVEVDAQTGFVRVLRYVSVHDCGNVLNETIATGQHVGALAHGIGAALFEELPYDSSGQPLHQSFMEYLVPTSLEIPEFTLDHIATPNPNNPGGYKGAGETGAVSPPAVLANAVEDALRPLGVLIRDLPLKPEYLWRHVRAATGR